MKKIILIILISLTTCIYGDDWLLDEDAVILKHQNIFKVLDSNKGVLLKRISIRINNEKGKDYCEFVLHEDDFHKVDNISGVVKDTLGNIIKELENDQIKETSIHLGSTLHSDAKNKYFTLDHFEYPFIVEVSYDTKISSLFLWPGWYPQKKYPVLSSEYRLILQKPVAFNTYYKGINIKPHTSKIKNDSVYYWQLDSIPAYPDEPYMAPEDRSQYHLLFAPDYFATKGYTGSLKSWDTFSHWYRKLCRDKYTLSKNITDEIDNLIKNAKSDYEKIKLIYSFMQEKTRYVAIQLGVGGWQPYSAESVYKNRYGDCKDLSTFMIAALNHAGIKSYPALVKTRDNGIVYEDFPLSYFNHVITVVPLEGDTIWLENTVDHLTAGEIPWTDEGCSVFIVTDSTGEIINTPLSRSSDNAWKSKIEGEITPQGKFNFSGNVHIYGNQKNYISGILKSNKSEDFDNWLKSRIGSGIPGFKLENYNIENIDTLTTSYLELTFDASIKKFGNKTGKRLFINPNILNERTGTAFEKGEEREYPIWLHYAYIDIDTVIIKLPYGYNLEAAPKEKIVDYPFGRYFSSHEISPGVFKYFRHFEYKTNHIPAEKYEQVVEFTNAAIKKDQAKYVFKKH